MNSQDNPITVVFVDRGKEGLVQTICIKEIPLIFNWNTVRLLGLLSV